MKRLIKRFFTILILATSAFGVLFGAFVLSRDNVSAQKLVEVEDSAFSSLNTSVYFLPARVILNDHTFVDIEKVGLAEDGSLGTPSDWNAAGWYEKSVRPGEAGNMIIDGHYDTNTGSPGAFWSLKNLKVNDKVVVQDEAGRYFDYQITEVFYLDINDSQRLSIFEGDSDSEITLITCGGVWDYVASTYNKRLVVKGKLISF